ncbi:hypothetical protein [Azorhizobium sp. AG788]|uniref:hypothetical protein n=1 Tax=Azorhizobium sp. AG788 TaxID=2183897 RepID=UPI00313887FE
MKKRGWISFSRKFARINDWLDQEARLARTSPDVLFSRSNLRLRQLHPCLAIPRACFDARVEGTPIGQVAP